MTRVRLTAEARADLLEIWAYLADFGIDLAERKVAEITSAFDHLEAFPYSGRARDELIPGCRSHAVPPYVIIYRVREPGITILRVVHGARDFSLLFPSEESQAE